MQAHAYAAHAPKADLKPFDYDAGPLALLDVEVRVSHCGICHSDLEMIDNNWGMSAYPLVPGHEAVGKVVAVGANVAELKVGDTVGVGWTSGSCLTCRHCAAAADMLRFCAAHGVRPVCEQFAMRDVNRALTHVRENKARYRVVLAA